MLQFIFQWIFLELCPNIETTVSSFKTLDSLIHLTLSPFVFFFLLFQKCHSEAAHVIEMSFSVCGLFYCAIQLIDKQLSLTLQHSSLALVTLVTRIWATYTAQSWYCAIASFEQVCGENGFIC